MVVLEGMDGDRVEEDVERLATLLEELGSLDVYVLPPTSGAALIAARERAFFVGKAAGCDDLIDAVIPRAIIPEYLAQVAVLAQEHGALITGCGHIGDGNVHITVFQPDDERRHALLHASFELALRVGGAISGEHGIGTAKLPYFLELQDPVSLELMRSIKRAFDPRGHPRAGPAARRGAERGERVNGARALLSTLVDAEVDVCFANPGTSEMHFVAALDDVPAMRGVLCLFEGVVTGAADGYGRVAGRPAATLLHLGPGLGNGLANLHNARRARTPIVNVVGDHATYHARYDAPLQSDIASIAGPVSGWYRAHGARRRRGGRRRRCRGRRLRPAGLRGHPGPAGGRVVVRVGDGPRRAAATCRRPSRRAGRHRRRGGQGAAQRRTGRPPPRRQRATARRTAGGQPRGRDGGGAAPGRDLPGQPLPRCGHPGGGAVGLPGGDGPGPARRRAASRPGRRRVAGVLLRLPGQGERPGATGVHRAHAGAAGRGRRRPRSRHWPTRSARPATVAFPHRSAGPDRPTGAVTTETLAAAVGAALPEGAIVVDEGNTAGLFVPAATAGAPRHDWLTLTGGAIGIGLPMATGAAVAAPERPVLCLQADGSAMYTVQALWTQAREGLNVTTLVLSNRSYAILNMELHRVGADAGGPRARRLLDLTDPELDFCDLARGMGVPARRVENAEDLTAALAAGFAEAGPALIEVLL